MHQKAKKEWRLFDFRPKLIDGMVVTMPDTDRNQEIFPQTSQQKEGIGFPIARMVGVICLSTGALLDCAIGPYKGKKTGEFALLRELYGQFEVGDLIIGDRYYASYFFMAYLIKIGAHGLFRSHGGRKVDFRRGKRLGKKEHLVKLRRPIKPEWMEDQDYEELPESICIREVKVGGIILVTTILDEKISRNELKKGYDFRWNVELDLRNIKTTMKMEMLRCKSPEMVRKEIWMHFLGYNLVRTIMTETAKKYDLLPRTISFKGTLQAMNAFRLPIRNADEKKVATFYDELLKFAASNKVGDRPGRIEPRAVKRRPKPYPRLKEPRHVARQRLLAAMAA